MKKATSLFVAIVIFFATMSNTIAIESTQELKEESNLEQKDAQEIVDENIIESQYMLIMENILEKQLGSSIAFEKYGTIHVERQKGKQFRIL